MKKVFIFPNKEQRKFITKSSIIIDTPLSNVDFINSNSYDYKVMCCNEEALYFFYKFLNRNVIKQFSNDCLVLYDKVKAKKMYNKFRINHIQCCSKNEFPMVCKPNFGFASIGVKVVNNKIELNKYINEFNSIIRGSEIDKLKDLYFSDDRIFPICEKQIKYGYFFSVPFIYNKETGNLTIFPVEGVKQSKNKTTDLYWTKFIYNEEYINKDIYNMIRDLLYKIATKFKLRSSVNMAEVIYDFETDKVYLVEFSPRIPGGRLSQLILYGSGVNLNKISVDIFCGRKYTLVKKLKPVELLIEDENCVHEKNRIISSEVIFSKIFNKKLRYSILYKEIEKVGLVPGRFAPPHKGHQFVFDKACREMDKVVVLIFDTSDTKVPLSVRANWIRMLYPKFDVIEAFNCPDGSKYAYEFGQECAFIQNKYICEKVHNYDITHVYHSVPYGKIVSRSLNAIDITVDLDRENIPISGTKIRSNPEVYKDYINETIYSEYRKYI